MEYSVWSFKDQKILLCNGTAMEKLNLSQSLLAIQTSVRNSIFPLQINHTVPRLLTVLMQCLSCSGQVSLITLLFSTFPFKIGNINFSCYHWCKMVADCFSAINFSRNATVVLRTSMFINEVSLNWRFWIPKFDVGQSWDWTKG